MNGAHRRYESQLKKTAIVVECFKVNIYFIIYNVSEKKRVIILRTVMAIHVFYAKLLLCFEQDFNEVGEWVMVNDHVPLFEVNEFVVKMNVFQFVFFSEFIDHHSLVAY